MNTCLLKQFSLTLAACAIGVVSAFSAPYEKGQRVESFQAKDQFENAFTFKPAETRFLLVSMDMETGKKANAALTSQGKDFLPGKKAVYMANINGMPAIGRMFALPKMKKYAHRIVLGDDAALIAHFPQQAGKVTVLALADGKVESVKYWTPGAEGVDVYLK
ncbi:MAG: hypothetical protein ABI600_19580 [Luteolibacter sp.]